ncbi:MAG: tail fiber protein [Sodalis sp. (in: enterobacteria)]
MSYLKESPAWEDGIYQIETSDPVLGGPEGITNRPPRELANRTAWLKQQMEGTQAALEAHANSRNHPDATLAAKGFVQLSNATYSQDESTAATPKLVNDRVNAIVDNAPLDLDTLNKLAQAISNNPKFAESVTQLLSQKLAKNENGADIPDKNQFIKNLGLTETIVPVGVPLAWPTENPPAGWLKCNGDAFDKVACPQLAVVYPSGRTPDLRGEFIRGWDNGRCVDPNRKILTHQEGTVIPGFDDNDNGDISALGTPGVALGDALTSVQRASIDARQWIIRGRSAERYKWHAYTSARPRNIAFNYIVRAA